MSNDGAVTNEVDTVSQNISIDIKANSLPVLIDPNNETPDGIFLAPDLIRYATEDHELILTPEDFGLAFYVDDDNDLYTNIEVISVSDDINLGYVHSNGEDRSFDLLSGKDIISIDHSGDLSRFILNDSLVDLTVRPNLDINGTEYIEFKVETESILDQIYNSNIFFAPVVDTPSVIISDSEIGAKIDQKNIKFIADNSEIYFELSSQGENSELMHAELSVKQGDTVIYRTEFDKTSMGGSYTVDLVDIINTFDEIGDNGNNSAEYIITEALEAHFRIEVEDRVQDANGTDSIDTGSFQLVEEVVVIPDSSRIKNDAGYRETLVGFSSFDNSGSDFSEYGESDDITFIDPDFGEVLSTDDSLNGSDIDSNPSVILGTQGTDFIFAKSDQHHETGSLIHGAKGFDDISGGEYDDIIYLDFSDDGTHDTVSGGMGDDVFVFHGGDSFGEGAVFLTEDETKQDMNNRLESLLIRESIDSDDVSLAGVVQDFSIAEERNGDSIVLSGFSEDASHSLHTDDDWALLLVEDDNQEKLYTAAILMSEYGAFDSSDMDLMNDAIHKI